MAKGARSQSRARRSSEPSSPVTEATFTLPLGVDSPATEAVLRAMSGSASWASWLPFFGGGQQPDSPVLDNAYLRDAWISACVDMRSAMVGGLPLRIYDRDPDDPNAVEVTSGQLYDLLARPMESVDATLFHILLSQQIDLSGESVLFLRDKDGAPVRSVSSASDSPIDTPAEIVPVRGDMVNLQIDPATGYPILWSAGRGTLSLAYPPASVVNVFETIDPDRSPWRGIGRLQKAFGYAAQNYLARRYQSFILKNNGTPAGVITVKVKSLPTKELRAVAQADFDQAWNDQQNAGKHKLLWSPEGGEAAFTPGSIVPKDMEYGKLLTANKEDIAAVFSTPGALLGQDVANYATFAGTMRMFSAQRLKPFCFMVAEAFNNRFIARLRDPALRKLRVRFDTEALDAAYANIEEHAQKAKALRDLGLPIGVALRESGIKIEPFPGDDVSLVPAGYIPIDMAVAQAKAAAATALQDAGVPGPKSFELVGLNPADYEEPPPPPALAPPGAPPPKPGEPPAPAPPAADEPAKALALLEVRDADALAAVRRAAENDRFASRAERTQEWHRLDRLQAGNRRKVRDATRKVFWKMRAAQLSALTEFAETGSAKAARESDAVMPVYAGPAPYLPPAAARGLLAAIELDAAAGLSSEPTVREVCSCCGDVMAAEPTAPTLAVEAWARRHPGLARDGVGRMRDLALLQRAVLSESQLDQIIVVQEQKWAAMLAVKLEPLMVASFTLGAEDLADQLGVSVIDLMSPEVLKKIAARAIEVAEGSTSVVAQQLRSALIDVLKDHTDLPSLQEAVQASLSELKAATSQVFNASSARALTIARTEVGIASESARFDTLDGLWKQGTIAGTRWLTSGQPPEPIGTTRPWHFSMDGEVSTPDRGFVDGHGNVLRFPLDPFAPPDTVINCRCHLVAVPKEQT